MRQSHEHRPNKYVGKVRPVVGKTLIPSGSYDALPLVSQRKCLLASPGTLFRGVHSRPHGDKIAFVFPIRPLYILVIRLGGAPV